MMRDEIGPRSRVDKQDLAIQHYWQFLFDFHFNSLESMVISRYPLSSAGQLWHREKTLQALKSRVEVEQPHRMGGRGEN